MGDVLVRRGIFIKKCLINGGGFRGLLLVGFVCQIHTLLASHLFLRLFVRCLVVASPADGTLIRRQSLFEVPEITLQTRIYGSPEFVRALATSSSGISAWIRF